MSVCDRCVELEASLTAVRAGNLALQERITAMHLATARFLDNCDRWRETGIPATPEESKSIYDQIKSALSEKSS
jgi:hypothetical protein